MWKGLKRVVCKKVNRGMVEDNINMEHLNELLENGAILIDVRSPQEYKEGHINGAICIPEYEIKFRCKNEIKNEDKIIVVYCSSGKRSKKAQKILREQGFKNVYNLYHSI